MGGGSQQHPPEEQAGQPQGPQAGPQVGPQVGRQHPAGEQAGPAAAAPAHRADQAPPALRRQRRGWLAPDDLVAVVGGGLGGLAAALALQQAGHRSVRVFERDGSFGARRQGVSAACCVLSRGFPLR